MSAYLPDDVPIPLEFDFPTEEPSEIDDGTIVGGLEDDARWHQRFVVSRFSRDHMKGKMHQSALLATRKTTPERRFNVTRIINWIDKDANDVAAVFQSGRVVARLSALPGMGKTMRLASLLAEKLNWRVCLVSRDSDVLVDVKDYVRANGLQAVRDSWSRREGARVCTVTYADFCSIMWSNDRQSFLKDFELFVFDEAHLAKWSVFTALRMFSIYMLEGTSALFSSATMSSEADLSGGSAGMGKFKELKSCIPVSVALDSEKLADEYLVDRTLVLVPGDNEVWDVAKYYEARGVLVKTLDSASVHSDKVAVRDWLHGDSVSERVLVAHSLYGIGHNLPVSYVITWNQREDWNMRSGRFVREIVSDSAAMLTQNKSRVGRGIVEGASGVVMNPETVEEVLYSGDVMRAFFSLLAAAIEPRREFPMWKECYERFPKGVSASIALDICKLALPAEISTRYLCRDGKFARAFVPALHLYAQPDHFLEPSVHEFPVGFESWIKQPLGSHGDGNSAVGYSVSVPVDSEGEMKLAMHVLDAVRQGLIDVPRWRPTVQSKSCYDSDSEEEVVERVKRGFRVRKVHDSPMSVVTSSPRVVPQWSFIAETIDVPHVEKKERRGGRYVQSPDFKRAIAELDKLIMSGCTGPVIHDESVTPVVAPGERAVINDVLPDGSVASPGGNIVCELPAEVCGAMNLGMPVTGDEICTVVERVGTEVSRFVTSRLFDCFAGPWDSILDSLNDSNVVRTVKARGLYPRVYDLVFLLHGRFREEVLFSLANSNVFKKRFLRVFRRVPTVDQLMEQIRNGSFDSVAQSDTFIQRVVVVKDKIDLVLLKAESMGIYLPGMISDAQRGLPLMSRPRLGHVGGSLAPMPPVLQDAVDFRSQRGGGTSVISTRRFNADYSGW